MSESFFENVNFEGKKSSEDGKKACLREYGCFFYSYFYLILNIPFNNFSVMLGTLLRLGYDKQIRSDQVYIAALWSSINSTDSSPRSRKGLPG